MPARALPFSMLFLLGAPAVALAHMTATGWTYDAWCCGNHDCQPISHEHVTVTPEGFLVSLPAGTHTTANRDHKTLFGYDEVRQSGDQEFHACILPHTQEFRCLYVPPFGF